MMFGQEDIAHRRSLVASGRLMVLEKEVGAEPAGLAFDAVRVIGLRADVSLALH
jgi:hypothetical protein